MATRDITTGAWHPERMDRTGATQRSRRPGDRSDPHVVQVPTPLRPGGGKFGVLPKHGLRCFVAQASGLLREPAILHRRALFRAAPRDRRTGRPTGFVGAGRAPSARVAWTARQPPTASPLPPRPIPAQPRAIRRRARAARPGCGPRHETA